MKPEEFKSHIKADQKEFDQLLEGTEKIEDKLEDMKEEDKEAIKKLSSAVAARILEKLAEDQDNEQFMPDVLKPTKSEDLKLFTQTPNGLKQSPNARWK